MKRLFYGVGLILLFLVTNSFLHTTSASQTILDTGFVSPTGFTNDDGNWQNGPNAFTDDETFARSVLRNNMVGRWHGYNITLPADAVITGIEVRIDALGEVGVGWFEIEVFNGTTFSTGLGTHVVPGPIGSNTPLSTTRTTYIAGGHNDLWNLPWDVAGASAIQVRVRVIHLNEVHRLYWVPVKIYYTIPAPPPPPPPTEIDYFALGDSVASGHGLNDDGSDCRRSNASYPYRVLGYLQTRYSIVNFNHLACSGAIAGNSRNSLPRQVQEVLNQLTDNPTLVTISIGANDFEWGNIPNLLTRLYAPSENNYIRWVENNANAVAASLRNEIFQLLASPNVVIIVTEYHNPFNTDSILFNLTYGNGRCTLINCYERTELGVHTLNATIASVVNEFNQPDRLRVAPIHTMFHGHESSSPCGEAPIATTWVQNPVDTQFNSNPPLPGLVYPQFFRVTTAQAARLTGRA